MKTNSTKTIIHKLPFFTKFIRIDRHISKFINLWVKKTPILYIFFNYLRLLTNYIGLPFYLYLLFIYTPWGIKKIAIVLILWLIGGIFVEFKLKSIFARLRPESTYKAIRLGPIKLKKPAGYSFPSGHGFNTGFITGLTILTPFPPLLKLVIITLSILVALSRIALGFHYVSDVITGYIVGIIYATVIFTIIT